MPLSRFTGQPSPRAAPQNDFPPRLDTRTPPAEKFIQDLNVMIQWQADPPAQFPQLEKFARIGIAPGRSFKATDLPADVFKAVEEGMAAGRAKVSDEADNLGKRQ